MIGNIRWNAIFGGTGFLIVFIASITTNVFMTTFIRSIYSGIILFVLAFAFRWILGTILHWNDATPETNLGTKLDLMTPDESDAMHDLIRGQVGFPGSDENNFAPLNPPKLVSKNILDPEELSKAIRHMTED